MEESAELISSGKNEGAYRSGEGGEERACFIVTSREGKKRKKRAKIIDGTRKKKKEKSYLTSRKDCWDLGLPGANMIGCKIIVCLNFQLWSYLCLVVVTTESLHFSSMKSQHGH